MLIMTLTLPNPHFPSHIKPFLPLPPTPTSLPYKHSHPIISTKSRQHFTLVSFSADFLQTLSRKSTKMKSYSSPSPHTTDIGFLFTFFQQIGLDEKETQLLLEKHPTLEFTSLECLQTRVCSLRSVGIDGIALYRVIVKRPEVLISEEIESLLCYIYNELEGKLEVEKIEKLLASTYPSLFAGFVMKVSSLLDHGISKEKLIYVLNSVNITKAFCSKTVDEIERTIAYLVRFGGIELIAQRPTLLNFDLNSQLIPRIGFLVELSGRDENATGEVLRKLPAILTYSLEHLESHVEFLRSFAGLSDSEIFRIIHVYPNVMSVSRERKLHPRIDFLKQCGLNSNDIFKFLSKAPLFLSLSFRENLSKKLGFLVKIGYENRTKDFAIAIGAVTRTSCENMQKVIEIFLDYGLSSEDILAMSKKHPQVLQYNHQSLEKKMEYLIEDIGREIGELLAFPAFLGYKLDDRIKHRYEVKKKILGEGMSLNKLLSVSTERFAKKNSSKQVKKDVHEEKTKENVT
ncbi:hypothetical protein IFM89_020546 [Coptis chinensis]|uniref:Transcription termination factor MTERF8, chloroplastic n=1 Tax=Coptis chinensis TaxID=261450 RepID=A0A835HEG1_9MAGN|nr:hypothetical protein IFM89_020546 [Coptis chinensis]